MTSFTSRYGNPADDYKGAHIWAQCRHTATVVAVAGRIDARNVDHVIARSLRVISGDSPFVLDLSGVTTFTPAALKLLTAVDDHCATLGAAWALVAGDAVAHRIPRRAEFAMLDTVAEAEHRFDDAILRRRGLLLPLLRRTA